MTIVKIELSDDRAAALQAKAAARGLSVPDWLLQLAEEDTPMKEPEPTEDRAARRLIWEVIADRVHAVPPEVFERLPTDGASQHDHYIYGVPKREQ